MLLYFNGTIAYIRFFQLAGGRITGEEQAVESTSQTEIVECGLVLRSVGYKSIPVESGIPYDDKKGIIPNDGGRVTGEDGLYCAGWLATGPRGVIVDTMNEAYNVAQGILNDWKKDDGDSSSQKQGFVQVNCT